MHPQQEDALYKYDSLKIEKTSTSCACPTGLLLPLLHRNSICGTEVVKNICGATRQYDGEKESKPAPELLVVVPYDGEAFIVDTDEVAAKSPKGSSGVVGAGMGEKPVPTLL